MRSRPSSPSSAALNTLGCRSERGKAQHAQSRRLVPAVEHRAHGRSCTDAVAHSLPLNRGAPHGDGHERSVYTPLALASIQNAVAFPDAHAWRRPSAPGPPARASLLGAGRRRDGAGVVLATRHRVPTMCTSWLHRKSTGRRARMGRGQRNYSHGARQRPRHSQNTRMRTSRRNACELSGMRWSHLLPNIHAHPQSTCSATQRCFIDGATAHTATNTDDGPSTRI